MPPADRPNRSASLSSRATAQSSAKRPGRGGDTRARLLAVAARLFAERGLSAARTADVAAAVGLSHGALFVHFASREALLAAVLTDFATRVGTRFLAAELAGASTRVVLEAHVAAIQPDEALYRCLVLEAPSLAVDVQSVLLRLQTAVALPFEAALCREAPHLAPAFPLVFSTWLGLLHHYVTNPQWFGLGGAVLPTHGPRLVGHFLGLIVPLGPEEPSPVLVPCASCGLPVRAGKAPQARAHTLCPRCAEPNGECKTFVEAAASLAAHLVGTQELAESAARAAARAWLAEQPFWGQAGAGSDVEPTASAQRRQAGTATARRGSPRAR